MTLYLHAKRLFKKHKIKNVSLLSYTNLNCAPTLKNVFHTSNCIACYSGHSSLVSNFSTTLKLLVNAPYLAVTAWCSDCPSGWNSDGSNPPICYNHVQSPAYGCRYGCDIQTAINICKSAKSTLPYFYTDDEFQKYKDIATSA